MRILLTHPHCWPYVRRGTERNVDGVSRSLAARGHQVTLLSTLPKGTQAPQDGSVRKLLGPAFWTPALRYLRIQPEHMFGISAYSRMQALSADVVHSFFYSDALAASHARKSKRWRTVLQLNGIAIPGVSCRRFPPEAWLIRRAIDEADEFIVCSSFIGAMAEQYYGRKPKVVVPPIDMDAWPFSKKPASEKPILLAVGDFNVRRKGIRVLLKAFNLFKQKEVTAILRISGSLSVDTAKPLLEELPESTRQSVELLGLGQPGDLPRLYQQASMLVLPAMWEPSGTVMFEAMASGTPVVATNHGGLPEFLTPETGVLFEPLSDGEETNDTEGLFAAMTTALTLSREPGVAERCRSHAGKFSSETIIPVLEKIYATQ